METHLAGRALAFNVAPELAGDQALSAGQQQLRAARQEVDTLRKRNSLLVTQMAALEQAVTEARRMAQRDELTGLLNRESLTDRVNQAVAQSKRGHRQLALLFLDLDGFKRVNDTLGHAAGNTLLQQVAARLRVSIRISDLASRYGGDEFVILLSEVEGERSAAALAARIREQLAVPYVIADTEITLTASIGMAVYPIHGNDYHELMQTSGRAMYRNKNRGNEQVVSSRIEGLGTVTAAA